jgi:hypothetical protein
VNFQKLDFRFTEFSEVRKESCKKHKKSRSVTRDCAFMRRNARYVAYIGYQLFETPLALRQRSLL